MFDFQPFFDTHPTLVGTNVGGGQVFDLILKLGLGTQLNESWWGKICHEISPNTSKCGKT
jgi:hypothetical protein